jgi:hypothetical protein
MARLLACPFCRELFDEREANRCPQCDIPLVGLERLPPPSEELADEDRPYVPPEFRTLSPWYWRRGRGALLLLALLGGALFFAPWVTLTRVDEVTLRGFDLARGNVPWLWGGALGWFLLVPLVASRRTLVDLWGIRVIAATFAAMTAIEVGLLLFRPPRDHSYFTYGIEYAWGLYLSGVVSLAAIGVALRLGGRLPRREGTPAAQPAQTTRPTPRAEDVAPDAPPDSDPPSGPRLLH